MDLATNYEQWEAAATMLDYLDGLADNLANNI
jgi:hypothetical protein